MKEVVREFFLHLQWLTLPAVILGGAVVLFALLSLLLSERRRKQSGMRRSSQQSAVWDAAGWRWLAPLLILMVVGAGLRLLDIDAKAITHPEVYTPGIPLPDGISEPPPRLDLTTLLKWHFFKEPHPVGYYLAMFGWTKLFGTSLIALRLPSAILGILSIPLMFRIGALAYDRTTGLIAAGFLALHGFHIYWSQMARMYVPECFLGLAATWLLLEMLNNSRGGGLLEVAYVLLIVAGFSTEWFFWPLISGHVLFTLLHCRANTGFMHRILYLQVLAMIVGGFTLTQAFTTQMMAGSGGVFSLDAIRDFLSFGFLTEPDNWSQPTRSFPIWFLFSAITLALILLVRGLGIRSSVSRVWEDCSLPAKRPLYLAAGGMVILMGGLALPSLPGIRSLVLVTFFPLIALAAFPLAGFLGPRLGSWLDRAEKRTSVVMSFTSLVPILAVFPVLLVFLVSGWKPLVVSRALLVFVPYLLIVMAAGVRSLARSKLILFPLTIALLGVFISSIVHFRATPSDASNYAALADVIIKRSEPDDVIFVPPREWYFTPLFYYLDASRLVSKDYSTFVAQRLPRRIWVVHFRDTELEEEMVTALSGSIATEESVVNGDRVLLYARATDVPDK